MSKGQRRKHSAEFKARIALEVIKAIKTVAQIAAENELHPGQVTQWKTQMLEAAPGAFERSGDKSAEVARLAEPSAPPQKRGRWHSFKRVRHFVFRRKKRPSHHFSGWTTYDQKSAQHYQGC